MRINNKRPHQFENDNFIYQIAQKPGAYNVITD